MNASSMPVGEPPYFGSLKRVLLPKNPAALVQRAMMLLLVTAIIALCVTNPTLRNSTNLLNIIQPSVDGRYRGPLAFTSRLGQTQTPAAASTRRYPYFGTLVLGV